MNWRNDHDRKRWYYKNSRKAREYNRYVITADENILIERYDLTQVPTSEDIFNEIVSVLEELFSSCTKQERLMLKEYVERL